MDALISFTARLTEKFQSSRRFSSAAWVDRVVLASTTQIRAIAPTSKRVGTFMQFSLSFFRKSHTKLGRDESLSAVLRCPSIADAACQILRIFTFPRR